MPTHRPKGGMCRVCREATSDCSGLPFSTMPVIGRDSDGTAVVKCTEYARHEQTVAIFTELRAYRTNGGTSKYPCPACGGVTIKRGQNSRTMSRTCKTCGKSWRHDPKLGTWLPHVFKQSYMSEAEAYAAKLASNRRGYWRTKYATSPHDAHVKAWVKAKIKPPHAPVVQPVLVPPPKPQPAVDAAPKPKRRSLDDLKLRRELFADDPLFS